ncbi:hypothetical protein VQL36_11595 [Chengkuizengella sp. SCS-71B]|uniref:hypothetical protein n=1 Tax=Chengkuizengella sp. SCS-71B TaxID=3115290 RepID=UPI0032C21645
MKIILPNNEKIKLDTTLNYEQRLKVVNELLDEWSEYFIETWKKSKTIVCLEILSNYLCLVKDEGKGKYQEDKYILSSHKMKRLKRGDKKICNFSDLPIEHQQLIGLVDFMDEEGGRA